MHRTKRRSRAANRRRVAHARLNAKLKHGCTITAWRNAKRKTVKFFGNHLWLVWGGEKQHIVYIGPEAAICDCQGWPWAYHRTCSHIQAVKNYLSALVS